MIKRTAPDRKKTVARTDAETINGVIELKQFTSKPPVKEMETIMTKTKEKLEQFASDATSFGKEQSEALTASGTIWAKGCEEIIQTYTALVQSSAERNATAFKTLLGSKTLQELTEAQNRIAQQNLDDFLGSVTKLSEISVRVASAAFEPINDQVTKSVKKAGDAFAA